MKAIEFPEVNLRIAEKQEEYETIPVNIQPHKESHNYFNQVTMCFELDPEEIKQVKATGRVWLTMLVPTNKNFYPIATSFLRPYYCSDPVKELKKETLKENDQKPVKKRKTSSNRNN